MSRRPSATDGWKVWRRNHSASWWSRRRSCGRRPQRKCRRRRGRKIDLRRQQNGHLLRRLRRLKLGRRRFTRRDRLAGRPRHAVAAASPRLVRAVGDDGFALGQFHSLARPENAVAHAVRNVSHFIAIEPHHARLRHIEVRVVICRHGIAQDCALQFRSALDASRNHGVGIYGTGHERR